MGGLAALAAAPSVSVGEPVRLPLKLLGGKLFTPAAVGGLAMAALIDPGSAWTALDAQAAAAAKVASGRRFKGRLLQGPIEGAFAEGVPVRLGEASFRPRRLVVADFGSLSLQIGRPVQLVLGRDFFDLFVAELDVERETLTLFSQEGFTAPAGGRLVDLRPSRGRMTLPVVVENEAPLWALVDVGSDIPLILSPGPRTKRLLAGKTVSTALIGGAGSGVIAQVATAATTTVAGVTLKEAPFQVAPRSIGFDGNLGLPILQRFRMTLDFGRRRMWLAPQRDVAAPFEKDLTGLNGFVEGGVLRILHVARGGPAERAGFKAGDAVTAIDGEAAATANANLTGAAAGRTLDFTLADGSHRRLTLAPYY